MDSNPSCVEKRNRNIIVASNLSEFSEKGATIFMEAAVKSVNEKGWFSAALSGGSTPRPVHRRLGREPYRSGIPWDRTHLFWVDERMLDPSDPSSNYGAAQQDLLNYVPIPGDHVYPMPTSGPMKARAKQYESVLHRFRKRFGNRGPLFDLVFLGVGVDGHVGSLFPETADPAPGRWTIRVRGGNPDVWRLSLTFEAINTARRVCFLISGPDKALILARVIQNQHEDLPARKIDPSGGDTVYLLDISAAALILPELHGSITPANKKTSQS